MRTIKPYGQSIVGQSHETPRQIRIRHKNNERDILDFMQKDPDFHMAQWIAVIDKIIAKPRPNQKSPNKKPNAEWRKLRDILGNAAWDNYLKHKADKGKIDKAQKAWMRKVHPYGTGTGDEKVRTGKWYETFAEKTPLDRQGFENNAQEIVDKIAKHLNQNTGCIADSIAKNTLHNVHEHKQKHKQQADHCALKHYFDTGDIAATIYQKFSENKKRNRFDGCDYAPDLWTHYHKVFNTTSENPALFALHSAIKDFYKTLCKASKHRSFNKLDPKQNREKILRALPKNKDALLRRLRYKTNNRCTGHLIRLGRIIHYTKAHPNDWPQKHAVENSEYWSSDGQIEIKQREAFVRVWRHVLSLANHSLAHWIDPECKFLEKDVLSAEFDKKYDKFDKEHYETGLQIRFGDAAKPFTEWGDAFVCFHRDNLVAMRNAAFHFKDMESFIKAAFKDEFEKESKKESKYKQRQQPIKTLFQSDWKRHTERIKETLMGAHADYFLDQDKLKKLLCAIEQGDSVLPLPRLKRVLTRIDNTLGKNTKLPPPVNQQQIEQSKACHCQYVSLTQLYARAFPAWLSDQPADTINSWIDACVERADAAAKKINKDEDAVARAAKIEKLHNGETIGDFLARIIAETAQHFQVQKGYESDGDQARKQAKYIEDLHCEVIGRAFEAYLREQGFGFILDLYNKQNKTYAKDRDEKIADFSTINITPKQDETEHWQMALYATLHLVPVDAVSQLYHQMRKFEVVSKKVHTNAEQHIDTLKQVRFVLRLYIDMCDAKFEGTSKTNNAFNIVHRFYDNRDLVDRVFKTNDTEQPNDADQAAHRAVREMHRFGIGTYLINIAEQYKITEQDVKDLEASEYKNPNDKSAQSEIEQAQKEREKLHRMWSRNSKKFNENKQENIQKYKECLQTIKDHRYLANRVRLVDHRRLHQLCIAVLARFVDYAGLCERDLYFVTLALLYNNGHTPEYAFPKQYEKLNEGRAFEAYHQKKLPQYLVGNPAIKAILEQRTFRNNFAHFNMLRDGNPLDLTEQTNNARQLMAYDRKLNNAVAKSIKDLLHRNGIDIMWTMQADNNNHTLQNPKLQSRIITHIRHKNITECFFDTPYMDMVADLFNGCAVPAATSVSNSKKR